MTRIVTAGRRGTGAALVAGTVLLGPSMAPAGAAGVAPVAEDPTPSSEASEEPMPSPTTYGREPVMKLEVEGTRAGGSGDLKGVVPRGSGAFFTIAFTPENKTYSDVALKVSGGKIDERCDPKTVLADPREYRERKCSVEVKPDLPTGAHAFATVTLTGKADGVPFTMTKSADIWSPDVEVRVSADGVEFTGQRGITPRQGSGEITVDVINNSDRPVSDVYTPHDLCRIKHVAPHSKGSCTFRETYARAGDYGHSTYSLEITPVVAVLGEYQGSLGPDTLLTADPRPDLPHEDEESAVMLHPARGTEHERPRTQQDFEQELAAQRARYKDEGFDWSWVWEGAAVLFAAAVLWVQIRRQSRRPFDIRI